MTGDRNDLYATLGVSSQATQGEIRRAYRTLMRHNHPDTREAGDAADAEARNTTTQQVIAAYLVLGDPTRRAVYDHHASPQQLDNHASPGPARRPGWPTGRESPIQAGPVLWHPS